MLESKAKRLIRLLKEAAERVNEETEQGEEAGIVEDRPDSETTNTYSFEFILKSKFSMLILVKNFGSLPLADLARRASRYNAIKKLVGTD